MNTKTKKLTPAKLHYTHVAKAHEPARPIFKNAVYAFVSGGALCVFGEIIQKMFIRFFHFGEKSAGNPTVAVLIALSALATGLGVYDKVARWAGAGVAVPVTGFANSIASAAIEHRSEGFILGVACEMFKVAGPVIVFGVVAAFCMGIIRLLIGMGG